MPNQLKARTNSTILFNKLTDRVGEILVSNQGKQLKTCEIYKIICGQYPERQYTKHQVLRCLEWLEANNSCVHIKNAGHESRTRFYWYQADDTSAA